MKIKLLFPAVMMSLVGFAITANAGSMNGVAGVMPAYYDDILFNINFKELPAGGESRVFRPDCALVTARLEEMEPATTGK